MPDKNRTHNGLVTEPFWYKSGVIYELHVRAFLDGDGDGAGDFRGLTEKLDYLKDLGVTALWLLPFYPSPLKDDGYDTADYRQIHPMYGTLADFKLFLREAHRRGLRVITELVLNHTSDQHGWFQRARRAKAGSRWRNFYVWSDDPAKYKEARIIFKDVEISNWTWDNVAGAYYWHRFFSHQPDLNYENPEVHEAMIKVLDFWFDLGVDGFRLDAVPYLYECEGTSCENLPETHAFLKKLRAHVDKKYGDRLLLAEANQWPEDAVQYFGNGRGDECHMAFHFPLMPRLFMALRMEDRTPIVDILEQTPPIPETSQWALFLRNHDELTLEMVTDEERDYMYRMYAQLHQARLNLGIRRRLAPLLGNDRKRIELLNALLFSLPGTPVLYYGDEIGMGENIYLGDRNGVRTPMQWSSDKNAGFSRANPQSLYLPIIYDPEYHYEAVNVEAQLQNPHSLLWWMRRLLALRKRWHALGEGKCEFLQPDNLKILAYILRHERETLLVIANLSRFVQPVELDLSAFKGATPIELFGRTEFPSITDRPYFLTLSPHAFFWFSLTPKTPMERDGTPSAGALALTVAGNWESIFEKDKTRLEALLPAWLQAQRWFGGKARQIKLVTIREAIRVPFDGQAAFAALILVDYLQGDSELYVLPLAFADGEQAKSVRDKSPNHILCDLTSTATGERGVLYDALADREFCQTLLEMISGRKRVRTKKGELVGTRTAAFRRIHGQTASTEPAMTRAEQSNSSVIYGDRFILKLFRRLDVGTNPDLEIGQFLTERQFPHMPRLGGALEHVTEEDERISLAVLHEFIPNARDAWEYTLDALSRYYDRIMILVAADQPVPAEQSPIFFVSRQQMPNEIAERVGTYLESARVLGERTAALHLALASDPDSRGFAPEPFTPHYGRGLFQSMRNLTAHNLRLLRKQMPSLSPEVATLARRVAERETEIINRYRPIYERPVTGYRIRCHGDFHLGQLLWTGKDFMILDFEGEPALPLSERRIKRSGLRDVASMVRSFHYAAWAGFYQHVQRGGIEPENRAKFEPWVRLWYQSVGSAYLDAYLRSVGDSKVLPHSQEERQLMFPAYLLSKAVYEVGYELNHRRDWLRIPLQGILEILETDKK